jgi:DNA modification methylase
LRVTGVTELVWDKGILGLGDLSLPWGPSHERILFGCYEHSPANIANGDGRLTARLRRGSVLRADRANSVAVNRHPTEKPVSILREMSESSSLFGETVLDPFAGSGSVGVAARLEGRRSILIELDERYCEVAAKRLAQQSFPMEVAG